MALPDRLSGREILLYLGLLRGMPREMVTERADELLKVLELDREACGSPMGVSCWPADANIAGRDQRH